MSAIRELREEATRALLRAGVAESDMIAVACSHGPDSLALADALIALRPGRVALVHVDHGLRPEAGLEAERVRAFAGGAGVPVVIVPVRVEPHGEGVEAAARLARHAALEQAAGELGARWIALGHHAGDQTETVLHRLLRGAGTAGLAGIPAVRGRLVRPLLGIGRPLIERYLAERSLTASRDAMNEDRRFLRARLRHDLLPWLRRENPALDDAVARAAAALREADEALVWMADRAALATGVRDEAGATRLDAGALAVYPAAVQKKLFLRLRPALEAAHLDALVELAARPAQGTVTIDLPGVRARREYGDLVLGDPAPVLPGGLHVESDGSPGEPYEVRSWLPGDRMRPATLGGRSRKLQDLFTDRKVPVAVRRAARVVVRMRDGEIVYAEHIGLSFGAEIQVTLT